MKQGLAAALALAAGLTTAAPAQTPDPKLRAGRPIVQIAQDQGARSGTRAIPRLTEGTPVVVVGEISSQPKDIVREKKMQVAIGRGEMDVTLHLSDAKLYSEQGQLLEADDLVDKTWVRAEGTVMDDPRRIKVTKLQVIGKDMPSLQRSAFSRRGYDRGYMMVVAGSREILPAVSGALFTPAPLVIVGKVSDDTGPLETTRKIQVDAAGNTWTLHAPEEARVVDAKGEKISVHEIKEGQWIRAHGWQTDDLRLRVARIENLGPEAALRQSAYYRAAEPLGYVQREPGTGVRFSPMRVTGVITTVKPQEGIVMLRDEQGRERTVYAETVIITVNGQPVAVTTLRTGQRVTIEGSDIGF